MNESFFFLPFYHFLFGLAVRKTTIMDKKKAFYFYFLSIIFSLCEAIRVEFT